jgi:hypothetical protein
LERRAIRGVADIVEGLAPRDDSSDARKRPVRPPRLIQIDGMPLTLNGWANRSGISRATIRYRRQSGWSDRDAILTPVGSKRLGP